MGYFGSEEWFYYGAIGDGINLMSRLEGFNKYYGIMIFVSEIICVRVGVRFCFCKLDRVVVKGKEKVVEIFEFFGELEVVDVDHVLKDRVRCYEMVLEYYLSGSFVEAVECFIVLVVDWSDDKFICIIVECVCDYVVFLLESWVGVY